ncbi:MAG: gephyrin-like molybdotransferase Glp [Ilumatobacteraceae bacterium]
MAGGLIPIDEAQRHVLELCSVTDVVRADSLAGRFPASVMGAVLAADVVSAEDVPPFANSAVDGYAVRSVDVDGASAQKPIELRVRGEVAAGAAASVDVVSGTAVRIMTGAPMPAGADCVVMVEDTSFDGDKTILDGSLSVRIMKAVKSGDGVRSAGDDVRHGETVFVAGTTITPAVAAVLASVNARSALVHRRPRVAVLSTGDELVDDGSALAPGQIRESNRTMLVGLVNASGVEAIDYGIVRDDEAALEAVLRDAANSCDAIVTSGGVSMGDYDVVKAVLSRIADMRWMQIAIKPAKPFAFGRLANGRGTPVPVFGLPGNPVSSLVSFELLARPALRRMAGHPESAWNRPVVNAIADQPLTRGRDGKVHYQRVVARFADDGRVHVQSVRAQASHQLAATALANAIAVVGDGDGVPVGGEVPVILLVT